MDDDDKKSEDEAAEPARDAAQDEGAKLREVSEAELKQILAAHETWLKTGGKEGTRADLSRTNLQGAHLFDAILTYANLQGANLQEANLQEANLQGTDLRRANLQGAALYRAKLQGANLLSANLTKAKDLTREQLDEACGNDRTQLPYYLAGYQMKPCLTPEQPPSN